VLRIDMKRRYDLVTIIVSLVLLISASLYVAAAQDSSKTLKSSGKQECKYNSTFDKDGDFVMCSDAKCGFPYQYDCDDSNKDVFKDCPNSLWSRFVSWLKKAGEPRPSSILTGNAVKILPNPLIKKTSVTKQGETVPAAEDCFTVICLNDKMNEIYCPFSYDECCGKYSSCRIVKCDDEYCEQPAEYVVESYAAEDSGECTAEYNDCYDKGTAVVCKGSFDQCAASFDGCVCGTSDQASEEGQAAPDVDTEQEVACETGVFVCRKQTITISGEVAESKVTCKESFQRCSTMYGTCVCGNSTLTDFPTKYIGSAGDASTTGENAENYWCDYGGRKVPCYMLPGNCTKKKNTCDKGDGIYINCDGYFDFCNKKYNGKCLCGVEATSSGFMYTE
jgi:hypothetical protein